jgi:hypothetical protein
VLSGTRTSWKTVCQHSQEPGEVGHTVGNEALIQIGSTFLLLLSPLSFLVLLLELFPQFKHLSIAALEECVDDEDEDVKDDI